MWEKKGLDELDCHIPLIIAAPWITSGSNGTITSAFAEAVDIMPTAIDLAGLLSSGLSSHFKIHFFLYIRFYPHTKRPLIFVSQDLPPCSDACVDDQGPPVVSKSGLQG